MQFLKESSKIGIFRLFQCFVKGDSISESGIKISFKADEIEENELLLMINIDIKKPHLKRLKNFVKLPAGTAIPNILLIYGKLQSSFKFSIKFFLIDLGFHKESELKRKEEGAKMLFEQLDLKNINISKVFGIVPGGVHGKQKNSRFRLIRPEHLLKEIRR
jgi:hypothetical protein